jgi:predicted nucleotidyltransferase
MVADVRPIIEGLSSALSARPEVLEAYLFGSMARGRITPLSDVDVAVCLDRSLVPDAPYGYAATLSAGLGSTLGRSDVDVVILNEAPPLLYHRVLTGGIRVFSRDLPSTTTREGRALSRYCDFVPHLRRIDAVHARRLVLGEFGR